MLSTEKSFEMFPRHNGIALISEYIALNLIIFNNFLTNNYLLHCNASLNKTSCYVQ